ncbi:MAG: gliding motility-associated C-terminal domain-containing protein [Bacteroidia bacterium]
MSLGMITLLFLGGINGYGQLQNNNWTFGNGCRVNFNGPTPNGALNSFLFSGEQCASVSNPETGSLLFYSDGLTVWGPTNQPMPNGTGLIGGLFKSSCQGPVIVPFPENPNKYFIFTIDELEFDAYTGLHYSVVDITLNGGLGDVEVANKNILLTPDSLTEKITVIRSEAIRGYWVIAHRINSNEFLAYKVTGCEVSSTPVVSAVGSPLIIPFNDLNNRFAGYGSMKANPAGTRLGMPIDGTTKIEFFDFDLSTGVLSNPISVEVTDNTVNPTPALPIRKYGCSFSPDGSKFYFSNTISVYQLDLSVYDSASIAASNSLIGTPANADPTFQIEQGPNGKLYVAVAGNSLAAINFPNNAGLTCGYVDDAISLNGLCLLGLPARVPDRNFLPPPISLDYDCLTLEVNASVLGVSDQTVSWNFGVPNGAQLGNPVSFTYADSGSVTITASLNSACFSFLSDTSIVIEDCSCLTEIQQEASTLNLGDTLQLNASGAETYSWTPPQGLSCTDCSDPLASPTETTTYIVTGSNASGCVSSDTITLTVDTEIDIECNEFFIPTIFSPNGKGPQANETLCLFSNCVDQMKFVIHNRWGQKVFETEDIGRCWDGTFKGVEAATGVYAYNLYLKQLDGTVVNKVGTVVLAK